MEVCLSQRYTNAYVKGIYVTPPLANVELNFAESLRCGEPLQCMQEVVCDWEGLSITAMEPTAFTVKIGLSGGLRGYQAITGNYVPNHV